MGRGTNGPAEFGRGLGTDIELHIGELFNHAQFDALRAVAIEHSVKDKLAIEPVIGAKLPRSGDHILKQGHFALGISVISMIRTCLRVFCERYRGRLAEATPQLLSDEWHDGMLKAKVSAEHAEEVPPVVGQAGIRTEAQLLDLQIPIAEVMPTELP